MFLLDSYLSVVSLGQVSSYTIVIYLCYNYPSIYLLFNDFNNCVIFYYDIVIKSIYISIIFKVTFGILTFLFKISLYFLDILLLLKLGAPKGFFINLESLRTQFYIKSKVASTQ